MLSLIIPAFDEEDRLPATLTRVREYLDRAGESYEVIVVDDGSVDATVETAEMVARSWPELQVMRLAANTGKGAAVRLGMLAARGSHRAFSDADLSTPMEELPRLRAHLGGRCQVAIGSRAIAESRIEVHQPAHRELMGRAYNRMLQLVALPGISDSQCGFKVFTDVAATTCFEALRSPRFGFDAEVLLCARRHCWEIAEVPVRWRHVEASRVRSLRDSSHMLYDLARLRIKRR
ncbi:MAG: dolichyl-phosphate beta-glucosyltransferase [Candidatus Dormibacteria bacterium]